MPALPFVISIKTYNPPKTLVEMLKTSASMRCLILSLCHKGLCPPWQIVFCLVLSIPHESPCDKMAFCFLEERNSINLMSSSCLLIVPRWKKRNLDGNGWRRKEEKGGCLMGNNIAKKLAKKENSTPMKIWKLLLKFDACIHEKLKGWEL